MPLAFLTLFGYFFVLSFFGWPLFVYELLRHRLGVRHNLAGASAFFSTLMAFGVLDFVGSAFRIHGVDGGWWSWVIFGVWLDGPFVLWLILRLRRPPAIADGDTKT